MRGSTHGLVVKIQTVQQLLQTVNLSCVVASSLFPTSHLFMQNWFSVGLNVNTTYSDHWLIFPERGRLGREWLFVWSRCSSIAAFPLCWLTLFTLFVFPVDNSIWNLYLVLDSTTRLLKGGMQALQTTAWSRIVISSSMCGTQEYPTLKAVLLILHFIFFS